MNALDFLSAVISGGVVAWVASRMIGWAFGHLIERVRAIWHDPY